MSYVYHVIKDPVHGTMQFNAHENQWVKPFIDSANFQRLRHIKQMGMGDAVFPGAVHTRFNHCLGCAYVASQIAQKVGLAEEERQLVIIAGLLHDIGHGPFSHTFEDLFFKKAIRHEVWTPLFLEDYCTPDFFQHYNAVNPRYHLSAEKFADIERMIMHQSSSKMVLADIVSSQLDADRLDYLLRDSHFCGVRYGEFDFRWMLHCLAIVETTEGERLGITHKGIGVVEHYLMARRLMMRNIYQNQKKLALEFYLIQLLHALSEAIANDAQFAELKDSRMGRFLVKVELFNQEAQAGIPLPALVKRFVRENYAAYRELCDYDVLMIIRALNTFNANHTAVRLAKRIHARELPKVFRLEPEQVSRVEMIVTELKDEAKETIADWQLSLIQTPHRSYSAEEDPILVVNEKGKVKPIGEISLMIQAITNKLESSAFLLVDKEIITHPQVKLLLEELV